MLQTAPWAFSLGTAIVFGLIGHSGDRHWFKWGFSGAVVGLVTSTIVLGLCEAVFIPMSHEAIVAFRIRSVLLTVLVIGLVEVLPVFVFCRHWRSQQARTEAREAPKPVANSSPTSSKNPIAK
jgi:hypothetical protein